MLSYELIAYDAINSLRAKRHVQLVHLSSIRSFVKRKLKDEGRHLYKGLDKRLHSRLKDMVEEGKLISDERGLRFGLTEQARKIVNQRKRDGLDLDFRLLSTPGKGRVGTATPRSSAKKRTLSQPGTPKKRLASGTPLKTPTSNGRRFLRGTVVDSYEDTESEPEQPQNLFDDSPLVRSRVSHAQSSSQAHKTPQMTLRKTPLRASQTKTRETPSRGVAKRRIPKSTPRRRLHTSNELTQEEFSRLEDDLAEALDKAARLAREKVASERTQRDTARQQKAELAAALLERDAAINAADQAKATMVKSEAVAKLAEDKWRASEAKVQELERRLGSASYESYDDDSRHDFSDCHDENGTPEFGESSLDHSTEEQAISSSAELDPENTASSNTGTTSHLEEVSVLVEQTEFESATRMHIEEVIVVSEQTTVTEPQMENPRAATVNIDSQTVDFAQLCKDYEILKTTLSGVESERDSAISKMTVLQSDCEAKEAENSRHLYHDGRMKNILLRTIKRLGNTLETERMDTARITGELRVAFEEKQKEGLLRTEELENARVEIRGLRDEESANKVIFDELRCANMAARMEMEGKATELQAHLDESVQSRDVLEARVNALTAAHASEKDYFTSHTQEIEIEVQNLRKELTKAESSQMAEVAKLVGELELARATIAKAEQEMNEVRMKNATDSAAAQAKLAELTNRAETAENQDLANRNSLNEKDRMVEGLQDSVALNERKIGELELLVVELGNALEKEKGSAKAAASITENLQREVEEKANEISKQLEELESVRSELCRLQEEKSAIEVKWHEQQSAAEALETKAKEVQSRLNESVRSHASDKASFESRIQEMDKNQKVEREEFTKVLENMKAVEAKLKVALKQVEDVTQTLDKAKVQITQNTAHNEKLTLEVLRIQESRDLERKAAQETLEEVGRKLTGMETEREELERRLCQGAELVELMRDCIQPMRSPSTSCSDIGNRVDSGVAGLQCTTNPGDLQRAERRKEVVMEE